MIKKGIAISLISANMKLMYAASFKMAYLIGFDTWGQQVANYHYQIIEYQQEQTAVESSKIIHLIAEI